ncbi:MAG: HupE/UreJ family protein [Pseudomonadota bacterium]|nr:HupE/UreJ family protein [Pseudomonadota bacterium]
MTTLSSVIGALRRGASLVTGIVLIPLILTVTSAQAHDPGMSLSHWKNTGDWLSADIVFARQDIEPLLNRERFPTDPQAGRAIPPESTALRDIVAHAIRVTADSRTLAPSLVLVEADAIDGVRLRLDYPVQPGSPIRIENRLLQEFGRGHRHFVTLMDAADEAQGTWLLSAERPGFEFVSASPVSAPRVFTDYLIDGVWHIWVGFDHLLFLVTLLLPAVLAWGPRAWQPVERLQPILAEVMKTVTAFTVAHSITLALAVLGIVALPARWVEVGIAASVIVAAMNNLRPVVSTSRWPLAFAFGLLHGFGFANVLAGVGLAPRTLTLALFGFNLGVELGQVAVVFLVIPVIFLLRKRAVYESVILRGGSMAAAGIAGVWFVQRLLEQPGLGP